MLFCNRLLALSCNRTAAARSPHAPVAAALTTQRAYKPPPKSTQRHLQCASQAPRPRDCRPAQAGHAHLPGPGEQCTDNIHALAAFNTPRALLHQHVLSSFLSCTVTVTACDKQSIYGSVTYTQSPTYSPRRSCRSSSRLASRPTCATTPRARPSASQCLTTGRCDPRPALCCMFLRPELHMPPCFAAGARFSLRYSLWR